MLKPCPCVLGRFAEAEEFFSGESELVPIVAEVAVHQMKRERYRGRLERVYVW